MIKILKYVFVGLLIMFGGLQFFRGDFPQVRESNPDDLFQVVDASDEVKGIIRAACYDCHSMETKYPWYSRVAPLSWWIIEHIEHGREELNFSDFNAFEKRRKLRKLKEVGEEVAKEKMPLPSYMRGHPEARLTDEQRALIEDWANQAARELLGDTSEE